MENSIKNINTDGGCVAVCTLQAFSPDSLEVGVRERAHVSTVSFFLQFILTGSYNYYYGNLR